MSDKVYVLKEHVGDFERSELDFELHNQFGFDYDTHSDFVEITKGQGDVDNTPIEINALLEVINELKSRGATHVSLDYHCDHIGYEFSGYRISAAEPALIEAYESIKQKEDAKQKEIQRLRAELANLENERRPLAQLQDDLPF